MPASQPPAEPDRADGEAVAETTGDGPGHSSFAWGELPDAVRQRLATLAAAALPGLTPVDVPPPVRPVARFAPAKRARLGAALVGALRDSPAFRAGVGGWLREHRPGDPDDTGADHVTAASTAVLLGSPTAGELVAEVARQAGDAQLRAERDAAVARAERLTTEVERPQGQLAQARAAVQQAGAAGEAETERLRARLREQGVRLRQAQDEAGRAAGGTGYPDFTLSAQRDRLAGALATLSARTGVEVTIVFDGAAVVAVPVAATRGVRVLFSDPGVPADDVIRAIVAAEPDGRPVVVVTSDRAVADSERGAHPVPSPVLLARLNRV